MKDANENNIDDNVELFGFLAGAQHLKNQQRQQEELARVRRDLSAERHAREAEELRVSKLPQCPFCGGRLEGKFRKCKHCASDISWVEDVPCEPAQEQQMLMLLAKKREDEAKRRNEEWKEKKEEWESDYRVLREEALALKRELELAELGVPTACAKCGRLRIRAEEIYHQSQRIAYLRECDAYRSTRKCPECVQRTTRLFWVVLTLLGLTILFWFLFLVHPGLPWVEV